jgi:hypothetical protein
MLSIVKELGIRWFFSDFWSLLQEEGRAQSIKDLGQYHSVKMNSCALSLYKGSN